jgi:hypothetical protein
MDRRQKKVIHLRIAQLLDDHCNGCEYRSINSSYLHCRNNCSIGKELNNCANMLLGIPIIKEPVEETTGQLLKGKWSTEEEFYLLNHAKFFTVDHLSKRLNRSYRDVYNKLWRWKKDKKISIPLKGKKGEYGIFS